MNSISIWTTATLAFVGFASVTVALKLMVVELVLPAAGEVMVRSGGDPSTSMVVVASPLFPAESFA